MKVLVTGGVRSGKSRHAESLLEGASTVRYVAPGPIRDDADWQERIAAHRARRPSHWSTVETGDLASALATDGAVLVDCLGTWLTRLVDDEAKWDAAMPDLAAYVEAAVDRALEALSAARGTVVIVTNEVGMGVVPEHRSGRVFRDLLGSVNQRFGAACDEVHLVVAGRVLRL
ncbi:bifunctional adenosylcobinamide kinase/adenosylcobinamide-phosphate guanylyltransferase [Nocardioides endophyticus]|uniref:Adenosylcobinamide kinase n=1 Tax=Nocardioides endophyticus TaxID=1353775 RepID=A0ABP8Z272_9ACTN